MTLDVTLAGQLASALGVGVLIGIERSFSGRSDRASSDDPELGVRTFAVLSLLGFAAALAGETHGALPAVGLGAAALLVLTSYVRSRATDPGITTEAAAIATCVLGVLCRTHHHIAGVLALSLAVVLASKRFAHGAIAKMRQVELDATLKFLAVVLILLPLLPNRSLDPLGVFNPYKVGLLVVLISGIGFVGYFLTRVLGARRGLGLAGVVGGLTSSTAVTAAMAAEARARPELREICAFATVAANATMFARVLIVVALLDLALAERLAWTVGGMTATALLATGLLWSRAKASERESDGAQIPLENPFSLGPALKFAAFFVFILAVLELAKQHLGAQGLYLAAALSGLADVDAITLSVSERARSGALERDVGAFAVTVAVVSNSITKTGIAFYSGGPRFGALVGTGLGAATAVGLAAAYSL